MSLSKLEERILAFLADNPDRSYKTDQIAQVFNYQGAKNYKKLVKALAFLERIGELSVTANGQFKTKSQRQQKVIGTYRGNDRGFGFINYDPEEADLFVPPGKSSNAMNGDTVEATIVKLANPTTGKGSEARIERIVERASTQLVGEFVAYDEETKATSDGKIGFVLPQGKLDGTTRIEILPEGIHPVNHAMVIVEIKDYPTEDSPHQLTGLVTKEIGHRDEPGVDILSILYQFDIPTEFPEQVMEEAAAVPNDIDPSDLEGRRDLRESVIITIDGADAKDLDDAVAVERLADGTYRLGVHIADVSHYVQEGSAIDVEALDRGTSVYLTDRVVPMLPQRLSNGLCSLLPNVDRLTLSCEMIIDQDGHIISSEIFQSVINSSYRMTYTDVNAILAGDEGLRRQYQAIVPLIETMGDLHEVLETMRNRRGAINFETTEAKIIVDEQGHPLEIVHRERGIGERMIESFMLAANETVARTYTELDWPMMFRVHEQPDEERIRNFAEFITAFGVVLRGNAATVKPKQLQQTLAALQGTPYEEVVSMMMLRSMQQARYAEEPLGHYGLAAKDYTHFTSPIRRYPDLIVHRLIHHYIDHQPTEAEKAKWAGKLPEIAEQSSKSERRAVDAERETDALKKAEFMEDKVGMQFAGRISSIASFGMFIQLPNTVEGLVSLQQLKDDYYRFDQQHLILIGERTNNVMRIGQQVLVEVEKVNVADRQIDFRLIEAYPTDNSDLAHVIEAKKPKKTQRPERAKKPTANRQAFKKADKAHKKNAKKGFEIKKRK